MNRGRKTLDEFDQNVIINSLFEFKNSRTRAGKVTDAIDDVLLKMLKSKKKRIKI